MRCCLYLTRVDYPDGELVQLAGSQPCSLINHELRMKIYSLNLTLIGSKSRATKIEPKHGKNINMLNGIRLPLLSCFCFFMQAIVSLRCILVISSGLRIALKAISRYYDYIC